MPEWRRKSDGFTFVEVIVAMTILALVFTGASAVYLSGYQNFFRETDRVEVQENLRFALGKMSRSLRQASGSSVTVYRIRGDGQREPSPNNTGPWIEFSTSQGPGGYRFDPRDKEIEEKLPGGTGDWQPLASYISLLYFEYDPAGRKISVVAQGEKGRSGPIDLSTVIHLRIP